MPRTGIPDWRAERAYDELRGIDRHGLMWEWLRRDEAYVAWQVRASTATRGAGLAAPADPHQWGLHFRRRSGAAGPGGSDHLACQSRSRSHRR
ncbi:transcriptional regulator domain-containing protein [Allosphingosinicella sp.]|uniref:transcriptional regulator domain-containing protein n=1 Tax=Allosphingosinicella sp. TaxID=2823234 RepID=UPI003D730932